MLWGSYRISLEPRERHRCVICCNISPGEVQLLYRCTLYTHACTHINIYIYIYIYMCVCVCVYIYIYIYIYIFRERERERER